MIDSKITPGGYGGRKSLVLYLLGLTVVTSLFGFGAFLVNREVVSNAENRFNEQQARQVEIAGRAIEDRLARVLELTETVAAGLAANSSHLFQSETIPTKPAELAALVYQPKDGAPVPLYSKPGFPSEAAAETMANPANPFPGRSTQFWIEKSGSAGVRVPVGIIGALTAVIDLKPPIERYVTPLRSGDKGTAYLLDDSGRTIHPGAGNNRPSAGNNRSAAGNDRASLLGDGDAADFFRAGRTGAAAVVINGERRFLAWRSIPWGGHAFVLVLASPESEIDEILFEFRRQRFIMGFFLLLTLTSVTLFFFYRRISSRLRAGERRYRAMVEDVAAVFFTTDKDGTVTYVSPEVKAVSGYEPEEVIGKNMTELVHEADLALAISEFGKGLEGDTAPSEFRLEARDGGVFWVRVHTRPAYRDGRLQGLRGVLVDVTDRKRIEADLEYRTKQLQSLIDYSGLAIGFLDEDHLIASCNRAFEEMFLVKEAEIVGRDIDSIVAGPDQAGEARANTLLTMSGKPVQASGRRRRSDGGHIDVEIFSVPIIIDGRVVGAFGIYRDISEFKKAQDDLREKEALYRTFFETAGDAIFIMRDGRFVDCNPKTLEMFGRRREEVIGRSPQDFSPELQPDGRASKIAAREQLDRALSGVRPFFEWRHQRPDGSTFETEVALSLMDLPAGPHLLAIVRDVSERKLAEQALASSEEKYRTILDLSGDGYYEVDLKGRFTFCNETFPLVMGLSREALIGSDFRPFASAEQAERTYKAFNRVYRTGRPSRDSDWKVLCSDGTEKFTDLTIIPIRDEKDEITGFRGIIRDVTDRKKAERALKESERRYRQLFDSISDLILIHDLDGIMLEVNPAVTSTLQYGRSEIIGYRLSELITPRFRRDFDEVYLKVIREKGFQQGVMLVRDKAGEERYLEYRSILVRPEGQSPYVTGSGRDVTDRIQAERELRNMEEQLLQAGKMEAIGTLASGISHDFNNLLQAMSGYIQQILRRGGMDQTDRRHLIEMDRAVERAADLVHNLLTFSRRIKPESRPTDLNREVVHTVGMLERTIPRMIQIETDLAEDLWLTKGDPAQFDQIVMNLATNARDAMPEGGTIRIETLNFTADEEFSRGRLDVEPGRYVLLRVTDSGQGMDRETASHIFEPFFTTKGVGQGTGLGLSSVYGIVKNHGGHITCRSRPGAGAVFEILLPALSETEAREMMDERPVEEPRGGIETILMVDDEPAILEVAEDVLTSNGYVVLPARCGEEAIEIMSRREVGVDLVVLDLGMPGMGGQACLKELIERHADLKVIIASGYAPDRVMDETLRAHVKDYLTKPYRLTELLNKIRAVLDEHVI